jgi:Ribbon-helix-helix domain
MARTSVRQSHNGATVRVVSSDDAKSMNVAFDLEQYERLREAGYQLRRPMSTIIREALDDWLDARQPRPGGQPQPGNGQHRQRRRRR